MDTRILLTTIEQVAILLTFILIGYFFRRKEIINASGKKVLASLLTWLFVPAYSIGSLMTEVTVGKFMGDYLPLFLAGAVVGVLGIFIGIPFAKLLGKDRFQENILKYTFTFGNIGYFGYPLIGAVFGSVARAQMMFFCLPITILIYTYGYYVLNCPADEGVERERRTMKQKLSFLYSPMMFGVIIGITLGLLTSGLGFTLPNFFTDMVSKAGACQSAVAMLLTGAVLANVPFKKLFTSLKPYLVGIIRLIVYPAIFSILLLIVYLCGWTDQTFMRIAMVTLFVVGMPVGMNPVIFPEAAGKDSTEGAKMCFISCFLALIVIPIVYSIAMAILTVTF